MNSLLSNPLKSIIFVFHWQLRMKTKEEIFIEQIKHKKVEEKYAAYRQLHPENPELDDYDVMEEEIYRWLFKTIDELPPRCKKIFLLHLDGKKNEEIAAQLKITLLTVKTQKKKALRYIREKMQDFGLLYILLI